MQAKQDSHSGPFFDADSKRLLGKLTEPERLKSNRVSNVKTVLVVLSSAGMVYDLESLKQKITHSYPGAKVYFMSTQGMTVGEKHPAHVDLLIDFVGPGNRSKPFLSRKLRGLATLTVGRRAGLWRPYIYDRIFDEKAKVKNLPKEKLERERTVQREVLALAGVALTPSGDPLPDLGKSIARELPTLAGHR